MEKRRVLTILVVVLNMMLSLVQVSRAEPMGTAWTYQGRLIDANEAADGVYDLQLKLFDDANTTTGVQQGSTIHINDIDVTDGYFTEELDFGISVFTGDARWLEVGVRPGDVNDPNAYTILRPRQEVTPVPYALQTRGIFVDDTGNIGIGTTTPGAKLEVAGSVMVSGTVDGVDVSNHAATANAHHTPPTTLPPSGSAGGDLSGSYPNPSVRNDSHTHDDSTVSDNISINNTRLYAPTGAGNVGIGTTNPASKLSVGGNGINNTGVYGKGSSYGVYGYSVTYGVYGRSDNVAVYGYGDTTGVIGEGVNCGVYGTSTEGKAVYGFSSFGYAGYFDGDCYIYNGDITIPHMLSYPWPSGGYNVKIVNGTLFYETSSSRYKENIEPFCEDCSKILQAEPKTYTCTKTGRREIGFIAEEFDDLGLSELVIYDQEGRPDAIAYQMISLYLLEVLKDEVETSREQEKAINQLEQKNQKLEERVDTLERMMQQHLTLAE